jgi:hypothetical protein
METRTTTSIEKDTLEFLNILRESGAVNMYGSTDYIIEEFNVSRKEAVQMLSLWMKNFNKEGNYDTIKK